MKYFSQEKNIVAGINNSLAYQHSAGRYHQKKYIRRIAQTTIYGTDTNGIACIFKTEL